MFSMRVHQRNLVKKAFRVLKKRAFRKSEVAREFHCLARKAKIFKIFKDLIKIKKGHRLEKEIFALFRMKRVLIAWKNLTQKAAKVQAIGEFKGQYNFCVKFSEYCKCVKCQFQRNYVDAIGPKNQNVIDKFVRNIPKPPLK